MIKDNDDAEGKNKSSVNYRKASELQQNNELGAVMMARLLITAAKFPPRHPKRQHPNLTRTTARVPHPRCFQENDRPTRRWEPFRDDTGSGGAPPTCCPPEPREISPEHEVRENRRCSPGELKTDQLGPTVLNRPVSASIKYINRIRILNGPKWAIIFFGNVIMAFMG